MQQSGGSVLLKNAAAHLPLLAPSTLLLAGNHDLRELRAALKQRWPECELQLPSTRHPVRLQTLARQTALTLLSIRLPALAKPVLPRSERELIDKLASLKQTILLLQSPAPIAMLPWHERVHSLLWLAPDVSAIEVVALLAGHQPSALLAYDLPRYAGNLQRLPDGGWVQRAGIRPAFVAGYRVS